MKVLKWWAWFLLLSSPYHSTSANRGTYTQTDTDIESLNVKSSLCCCHRSCVGWRVHIRVAPGMALMGRDWGSTIGAVDLAGTISFFNPWTLASLVSIASTSPPMHPDQPAAIYATGFYLLFCFRHVSFMPFPSFFFHWTSLYFLNQCFFAICYQAAQFYGQCLRSLTEECFGIVNSSPQAAVRQSDGTPLNYFTFVQEPAWNMKESQMNMVLVKHATSTSINNAYNKTHMQLTSSRHPKQGLGLHFFFNLNLYKHLSNVSHQEESLAFQTGSYSAILRFWSDPLHSSDCSFYTVYFVQVSKNFKDF